MKSFYIIVNSEKDPGGRVAEQIRSIIVQLGGSCTISYTTVKQKDGHYTDVHSVPPDTDGILVLGGDGTLIQAARDLNEMELPMLGINMGTLGYLSEIDVESIQETIARLMKEDYFLEKRMLIKGSIIREGACIYEDFALNDIVLSRKGSPRILRYEIKVNSELLHQYDSDGILIATPTGSTAYNLSAGGPIVSPEARLFVVTPICAHSLNSRSIILPENSEISISVVQDRNPESGWLTAFDGVCFDEIRSGDKVRIVSSEKQIKLIKLSKVSFLEILRKKMNHL